MVIVRVPSPFYVAIEGMQKSLGSNHKKVAKRLPHRTTCLPPMSPCGKLSWFIAPPLNQPFYYHHLPSTGTFPHLTADRSSFGVFPLIPPHFFHFLIWVNRNPLHLLSSRTSSTVLSRTTKSRRGLNWSNIPSPSDSKHATLLIPSSPFFKNKHRSFANSEETMGMSWNRSNLQSTSCIRFLLALGVSFWYIWIIYRYSLFLIIILQPSPLVNAAFAGIAILLAVCPFSDPIRTSPWHPSPVGCPRH